jgi:hypothetical protein
MLPEIGIVLVKAVPWPQGMMLSWAIPGFIAAVTYRLLTVRYCTRPTLQLALMQVETVSLLCSPLLDASMDLEDLSKSSGLGVEAFAFCQ